MYDNCVISNIINIMLTLLFLIGDKNLSYIFDQAQNITRYFFLSWDPSCSGWWIIIFIKIYFIKYKLDFFQWSKILLLERVKTWWFTLWIKSCNSQVLEISFVPIGWIKNLIVETILIDLFKFCLWLITYESTVTHHLFTESSKYIFHLF